MLSHSTVPRGRPLPPLPYPLLPVLLTRPDGQHRTALYRRAGGEPHAPGAAGGASTKSPFSTVLVQVSQISHPTNSPIPVFEWPGFQFLYHMLYVFAPPSSFLPSFSCAGSSSIVLGPDPRSYHTRFIYFTGCTTQIADSRINSRSHGALWFFGKKLERREENIMNGEGEILCLMGVNSGLTSLWGVDRLINRQVLYW